MKRTGLKFFKTCTLASNLIPYSIELKDRTDIAVCDIEIKDRSGYGRIGLDKEIIITMATSTDNIIKGNCNENASCDLTYQDVLLVDLNQSDEEVITQLIKAKDEGLMVVVR